MSDFCAHAYCSLILCFYCFWLCICVRLTCLELRDLRSGYGNRPAFSSFEFLLLLLYFRATLVYIEVRDVQSFPLLLYFPLCSTFLLCIQLHWRVCRSLDRPSISSRIVFDFVQWLVFCPGRYFVLESLLIL